MPAILNKKVESEVKSMAEDAYACLGCRGAARVDIVLDNDWKANVLEVNTIPGMTELSLLPMAAASAGMGFSALVERMLFGATLDEAA